MFASNQLEELAKKLYQALPNGLQQLDTEIQQQFKAILQAAFAHLDLVTREEFDVQVNVLERTRAKVEALETQIELLLEQKH